MLGEALVRPGALTRGEAFRNAAREGMRVMFVVTLLLLVCGFIEGYVSPDPEDSPLGARHHRRGVLAVHGVVAARLCVRAQPRRRPRQRVEPDASDALSPAQL